MFRVRLSEQLIESMTLAAVEAYCLGDGHAKSGLETYAYVWGYKRELEEETIFYLDRMSLSLSAARAADSVTPSEDAARLKNEIIERWSPHLTLLGDFHTHPHKNLAEVLSARDGDGPKGGFHFSAADRESFHGDDFLWEVSGDTPVNIVMTICRMGKVKESYGATSVKNHIWQYDVGEFRFWLTINIGYIDEDEERYLTVETGDEVYLELDSRFYNYAGDRVAGHIERD